jgi:hypothetical protein
MKDYDYKWLLKQYKEPPSYSILYASGYIRALYDEDFINRNQRDYLYRIIKKNGYFGA